MALHACCVSLEMHCVSSIGVFCLMGSECFQLMRQDVLRHLSDHINYCIVLSWLEPQSIALFGAFCDECSCGIWNEMSRRSSLTVMWTSFSLCQLGLPLLRFKTWTCYENVFITLLWASGRTLQNPHTTFFFWKYLTLLQDCFSQTSVGLSKLLFVRQDPSFITISGKTSSCKELSPWGWCALTTDWQRSLSPSPSLFVSIPLSPFLSLQPLHLKVSLDQTAPASVFDFSIKF